MFVLFFEYKFLFIYLFFPCAGSLLLLGFFSGCSRLPCSCRVQASHCDGCSHCGAQVGFGVFGLISCHMWTHYLKFPGSRAQAQQLWHAGFVTWGRVGSSWIRDWTHVSCTGRRTLPLSHQESPSSVFFSSELLEQFWNYRKIVKTEQKSLFTPYWASPGVDISHYCGALIKGLASINTLLTKIHASFRFPQVTPHVCFCSKVPATMPRYALSSDLLRLLWAATVSQIFLGFDELKVLGFTAQVFCMWSLNWDLSDVFLMFTLGFSVVRKSQR